MGPNFDPCGAPHLIYFADDFLPLIEHQVEKEKGQIYTLVEPRI